MQKIIGSKFMNCEGCGKNCGGMMNATGGDRIWKSATGWSNDDGSGDLGITDMSGINPNNPPTQSDNSGDSGGSWLSDLNPNTALSSLTSVLGAGINKGILGGSSTPSGVKAGTTTINTTKPASSNTGMVIALVLGGAVVLGGIAYVVSKRK
jgi:hypothetical protein